MNINFTHKSFTHFTKTLLIAVIVCLSILLHSNIANAVSLPIGIQTKTIKCYPNPAIAFINFELPADYISKNYSLQVYSFTGKKMYEVNVSTAKLTLTFTNEYFRGIYVYQLRDKDGRILETGKF